MPKLSIFTYKGQDLKVKYVVTQTVKDGVECDIYAFKDDPTKDLAIVRVKKGFRTSKQLVVKGSYTIEGYVSGLAELTITNDANGDKLYTLPNTNMNEVSVGIGEIMQWNAIEDLVFYELCDPPYEDGRFKDLE